MTHDLLQVTGMLTVEFLFTTSSPSPAPAPAPAGEVARFSGVSHSEARTVVNKPLGIMKQPQPDPGTEAAARKTFSPYFEYNGQQQQQDLLKPPSRSSSMKRTAFAEPLEMERNARDPSPAQLREIADCRVAATSTASNTALGEALERGILLLYVMYDAMIQMQTWPTSRGRAAPERGHSSPASRGSCQVRRVLQSAAECCRVLQSAAECCMIVT